MRTGVLLVLALASVAAIAAVSALGRPTPASASPSGVWNLHEIEEDNGTVHGPPAAVDIKYVIDETAHTLTNQWFEQAETMPYESTTFSYTVQQNGNWFIANAGPDGRTIEFSVAENGQFLTLTRVAYSGPDCVVPPAPIYPVGGSPPASPGTIPPPKKFILRR